MIEQPRGSLLPATAKPRKQGMMLSGSLDISLLDLSILALYVQGLALYVRDCFDCTEINSCDDKVECLSIKMEGKTNKADILLGVCYRPPNQDEEVDEVFYKRLAEVSQMLALLLMDFNLPDLCWKYNTAERKQSRRFLECVDDNFLMQLLSEPTSASLDLLFTKREELVGDVVDRGHLGLSDYEMIK